MIHDVNFSKVEIWLVSFILLMCPMFVMAQNIKVVKGEYTYLASLDVSMREAKEYAIKMAKLNALAKEFGTSMSLTNSSFMKEDSKESVDKYLSIAESEVNGEWIETIGTPDCNVESQGDNFVVTVHVKGKARAIKRAQISFSAKLLRNSTEDRDETDKFHSGDDMFLAFQSPVSGYCLVYLVDEQQNAFCLLPYRGQTNGNYPVKANQRYVFFSMKEASGISPSLVDEYQLSASDELEYNQVYVIFSPHPFVKTNDQVVSETYPSTTTAENFKKWLARCRKSDVDMVVQVKNIVIIGNR